MMETFLAVSTLAIGFFVRFEVALFRDRKHRVAVHIPRDVPDGDCELISGGFVGVAERACRTVTLPVHFR